MSEKVKVTFEYSPSDLFDTIVKVGDNGANLGTRIVGVFLQSGQPDFFDAVGMLFYSVSVVPTETSERDRLAAENRRLREALENIADPIGHVQREAGENGYLIDGVMALRISNDAGTLKAIARKALSPEDSQ